MSKLTHVRRERLAQEYTKHDIQMKMIMYQMDHRASTFLINKCTNKYDNEHRCEGGFWMVLEVNNHAQVDTQTIQKQIQT